MACRIHIKCVKITLQMPSSNLYSKSTANRLWKSRPRWLSLVEKVFWRVGVRTDQEIYHMWGLTYVGTPENLLSITLSQSEDNGMPCSNTICLALLTMDRLMWSSTCMLVWQLCISNLVPILIVSTFFTRQCRHRCSTFNLIVLSRTLWIFLVLIIKC